ncbi:single-stranded-DNA-specific exonuclease RecJ [Aliikangiella marina]|uniref:Single-stranded-DNA-specific exonuclease RecJ n=1 Tax=Aliikangiella marina TaxID=1712262 RepID=A0A545THW2_9GAMM|nr:single-stranded-DNA-specific exonuclease RecJ [Aliikangiella marina]TQV76813.1 single-stranded-DNA-specific exonuclease RecJ [Aliikangiella marina]
MVIKKIKHRESSPVAGLKDFHPKIQSILSARGINDVAELDYRLANLISPTQLLNIEFAAEKIFESIQRQDSILIVGDFDCDGATSSAVMIKALRSLGAKKVNYLVPDRFAFGYGLSVKLVEHAATLEPDLMITVDNGIANIDGVARANDLNIPVIITDHHLAGDELPDALAIVNPNQPRDSFSSKHLAGVGVAFYTMLVLRNLMRQKGWFQQNDIEEPNLAALLDIVALGTVADVVVLDNNNRILVEQGLKRIRSGHACPGIQAILQVAKRDINKCQASDLGFAVGPRLNAAGRLDDMSIGIECLLANSIEQALPIASRLDNLNRSRREIEGDMLEQAKLDLESYFSQADNEFKDEKRPLSMCLFDPNWHQGVIGILASRVKDRLNRPTIVFARDDDSEQPIIKGSARSVKGVHIRDALALIDSHNPKLIEKFGGHAMAAGLSIKQKDFQVFAERLNWAVEKILAGNSISDEVLTDGHLDNELFSLSFAAQLKQLGPWGQGFPEPTFDNVFKVANCRLLGEAHLKLVLVKDEVAVDAIYFRCPENQQAQVGDTVVAVYKMDINEFRGETNLQLMIEQLEIIDEG